MTLTDLKDMGLPDHTSQGDLASIAGIVTGFLTDGHTMLSQTTKSSVRRELAGRILAGINEVPLLGEGEEEHV